MNLRQAIPTLLLFTACAVPIFAQENGSASAPYTLKVSSDIVLTNVIVRDKKTGALIKDLKASDFTVYENGKQQKLASFDYQNVDDAALLADRGTVSGHTSIADLLNNDFAANPKTLHDHRLMVFFFDLSSMQPEDVDRAVDAAVDFVNHKMQPADLVALVSLDTGLSMDQDFTADKTALLRGLSKYGGTEGTGFTAGGTTGSTAGTADDASSYAADDSEYASLNTDRELYAIESIAKALERVDGRKSMLYFSGGLTRQGIENQASLRVATNEAVKANMAIYSVDARGLEALPPVGDASTGSLRGTSSYNGQAMQANLNSNFASQETLGTLAMDTGGKFFSDSNDFAPVFQQVQHDTEAYYILGFRSTDPAHDGRFRHLTIKLNRGDLRDAKLEYRPGYYAAADFKHSTAEDREVALAEQMRSDLPATDVPLYLQALYFKLENGTFYVPVSLIVPGSAIPFLKNGDKDKATLDLVGQVKNAQGIDVGNIRDTVKLNLTEGQNVKQRNIQYTTGFDLATGKYHLKFVVRENQTGQMGSFETDLNVPDFKKEKIPLKLSSIVLASQRVPNKDKNPTSPLIRDGEEWVPNIPHVFRQDQHLYFLYEVYDPAHQKGALSSQTAPETPANLNRRPSLSGIRVLTSIEFILGGVKVYETPLVEATAINSPARSAVSFQFDVPLAQLKPGDYRCQVTVVDDASGSFSFPQLALRITAPGAPTSMPSSPPAPAAASPSATQ
jgi:VWFA-related protein